MEPPTVVRKPRDIGNAIMDLIQLKPPLFTGTIDGAQVPIGGSQYGATSKPKIEDLGKTHKVLIVSDFHQTEHQATDFETIVRDR